MALAAETDGSPAALAELRAAIGAACTLERRDECVLEFGIDPAAGVRRWLELLATGSTLRHYCHVPRSVVRALCSVQCR